MAASLPFDPSVDGVGLDEATGDLYFVSPMAAELMADYANVERHQLVKLDSRADPIAVAALINPVSSTWMALRRRLVGDCQGSTVLILGVTSASGRAAVLVARELGAARVVGVSRSEDTLAAVDGLDDRVVLRQPFVIPSSVGPVDIILDFVGGGIAIEALHSAEVNPGKNLEYIHIGDLAGEEEIAVPARLLNKKPIRITGSGMGSWSKQDVKEEISDLLAAVSKMKRPHDVLVAPLADVQSVWDSSNGKRLVLVP
jgi:NADPH:quinone reductase-like Zn-dependent oxidoreductase